MIAARQQQSLQRRVRQFFAIAVARQSSAVDAQIRAELNDDRQWCLVQRLAPADRAHMLAVFHVLQRRGHTDADLLRAALLHDTGKADERGRVRLAHRVARVVAEAIGPEFVQWLSRRSHGMYLAVNHAVLGARLARDAGASERCCWLIAHHEDVETVDEALQALIAADREAV